ncbi:hypothetical protein OIU84_007409 [Salix udensis]|uniref:Uncharacterized protein n=1 Tax=Salix udensis TaxID=889485 RepID=A0AAD6NZ25_9ROSI|nr:hypothetical protein OIU84_007409 [Salix udensis]
MVARAKHGRSRPSLLSHTFNMRGKIAMPVPDNSCGNFINVALSHYTEDLQRNKEDVYEADFGWGKPGWVSGLYVPGVEMVLLVDTKDGDGIEAWVSLEEDTVLLFQENPDIKAFTGQE